MTNSRANAQILKIAREILASDGLGAVSFDAIARRLGHSKQAVLYWYPSKHALLAAMFLPWLEAEAELAARSVANAAGRAAAIEAFVGGIARFHLDDLGRFRMMYLLPQTMKPGGPDIHDARLLDQVHTVTDKVYGALAAHLGGAPLEARREAVAIHAAVLGVVLMFGLAESTRDPMKHADSDLIDALIASLLKGEMPGPDCGTGRDPRPVA